MISRAFIRRRGLRVRWAPLRLPAGSITTMQRLLLATVAVIALASAACAPSGYMYEVGNFTRPHPTQALCASRGQVLDMTIEDCVTPPPPPPPSPMQVAQAQQSNVITSERNTCVSVATAKFKRGENGQVGSYAIWRTELKECEDRMLSRLTAQKLKSMGGDCSLKLDWMLRYQMMLYDPVQKAMAEQRYEEYCSPVR